MALGLVSFLSSSRGSAIVELLEHMQPGPLSLAVSIFSDAALEPASEVGTGGFILGHYWRVARDEGLHGITVPVFELLAGGVNLSVLFKLLGYPSSEPPPMWVRWEIDALSSHFTLKNESAASDMMRFVHMLILQSVAFKYFKPALVLCHVYGPANPGDAPSRGKLQELHQLASALRFTLKPTELPDDAVEMIEKVVDANDLRLQGKS